MPAGDTPDQPTAEASRAAQETTACLIQCRLRRRGWTVQGRANCTDRRRATEPKEVCRAPDQPAAAYWDARASASASASPAEKLPQHIAATPCAAWAEERAENSVRYDRATDTQ